MIKYYLFIIILALGWHQARSQDDIEEMLHMEFEFGLGYSRSVSQNFFNDAQGIAPGGGVGINMAFRYHFNYNWSAGLHFMINADNIPDYDSDLVLGYFSDLPLSVGNVNLGFHGKYTYDKLQRWQPYILGGLGAALGGITTVEYQEQVNSFSGIAINMGMGIGYMANNYIMVSGSILRNYGIAWWTRYPSNISVNKQFDPGFWTVSLNISIFLQDDIY